MSNFPDKGLTLGKALIKEKTERGWWDNTSTQSTHGHVCHCSGCCPLCKRCSTHPRHAQTCRDVQKINEMLRRVMDGERLKDIISAE